MHCFHLQKEHRHTQYNWQTFILGRVAITHENLLDDTFTIAAHLGYLLKNKILFKIYVSIYEVSKSCEGINRSRICYFIMPH